MKLHDRTKGEPTFNEIERSAIHIDQAGGENAIRGITFHDVSPMTRESVRSSLLRSVGFDKVTGILELEFQNDHVYRYFEVSEFTHRALLRARSKGAYFHANIEDRYRFEQLA